MNAWNDNNLKNRLFEEITCVCQKEISIKICPKSLQKFTSFVILGKKNITSVRFKIIIKVVKYCLCIVD